MKKRAYYLIVLLVLLSIFASAQIEPPHEWNAIINVVDEKSHPLPGANVVIYFSKISPQGKVTPEKIAGISDANGAFIASHSTSVSSMAFVATKEGYYSSRQAHELGFSYVVAKWNPTITLTLKKIGTPIPMYAKLVDLVIPAFEKPVGYDLMVGDWVAPYGKGISSDIIFTSHYYNKHAKEDFDHQLIVSFPNAGDGVQPMESPLEHAGSELRSPHEAPFSGYESKTIRATSDHPGKTLFSDYDGNRAYFFQVRTALDEKGKVKSALYGKIYGDFNFFRYYLNPTPNDRNIEFDPRRNLISGQDITAP